MAEPVLQIKKKKYTEETVITSMRMPKDMIRDLDRIAKESGRTRNDLILTFIEFSIDHLEISGK